MGISSPITPEESMNQNELKSGMQILKDLYLPEGALTALITVFASLSVLPYIAGQNIGVYSVPNVIQGGLLFWILIILPPPLWVFLFIKVFEQGRLRLKRTLIMRLMIIEFFLVIIGFGLMPITIIQKVEATQLQPGKAKLFFMNLPAVNHELTLTVTDVKGAVPDIFQDVGLMVCGRSLTSASPSGNTFLPCTGYKQVSVNTPAICPVSPGPVQISVYNMPVLPDQKTPNNPATITLRVEYLQRNWDKVFSPAKLISP